MSFPWYRRLSLGLLTATVMVLGCSQPPSKVQFNSRLVEINRLLVKDALAFHKALVPAGGAECDPDTANPAAAQQAYDAMVVALEKVQGKASELQLPRSSKTAEDLKTAYGDYLREEQKVLDKSKEIVTALSDAKLSKADKKDRINKLLTEIATVENDAYRKLTDAQEAFGKAHYFKFVDKFD